MSKCLHCQADLMTAQVNCPACGREALQMCPACGRANRLDFKFCSHCGHPLGTERQRRVSPPAIMASEHELVSAERKQVCVLYTDLSGFTPLAGRLDPEEVKEITSQIFIHSTHIIHRYDGFIEKFVGDAVLALFGVPTVHEDDALRAVKAAREIHQRVKGVGRRWQSRIGAPLEMHSGIERGLVVTGEINLERGTHSTIGSVINLAARLCDQAKPGQILAGPDVFSQTEGFFEFELMPPLKLKGFDQTITVYQILGPKEHPLKTHRLHGRKAELIGRSKEMADLHASMRNLGRNRGAAIGLCGASGNGKSRLVAEFKADLETTALQWLEGHAFSHTQNTPYFPLIDLINRAYQIEEHDSPETVRHKIESNLTALLGADNNVEPYLGSLYALAYPAVEGVSPEFWKSRLQAAVAAFFTALARKSPVVFCFEDLHWADPSTIDLITHLLSSCQYPALFLCVYRPPFSILTQAVHSNQHIIFKEIGLKELSLAEAEQMLKSLLKTEIVPPELLRFVGEKVEGNPFYLEEAVNTLIETNILEQREQSWHLRRPIRRADLPSTIHGVIAARLDRLEHETKRVLQQAAVIGRSFYFKILQQIIQVSHSIDTHLASLEKLELIKIRTVSPELEYIFKHALTQEAVYNGLLKKERHDIHERIAQVIELLFKDRLPEFYEVLAYHYAQGHSVLKAVRYLMKAGAKSLKRYAVEEAHRYYKDAFNIYQQRLAPPQPSDELLLDLINRWALVFYYRGDFREMTDLLLANVARAEALKDPSRLGLLYAWLGWALFSRERLQESYHYLQQALAIGKKKDNKQIIGLACTGLVWTCADLGLLDEGLAHGQRARRLAENLDPDSILFFQSMSGMGYIYFFRGDRRKNVAIGRALLEHGQTYSNTRSLVVGHICFGHAHLTAGDTEAAIASYHKAMTVSVDPFFCHWPRLFLGMAYVLNQQYEQAQNAFQEVLRYCQQFGCAALETPAQTFLALTQIATGRLAQGFRMLEMKARILAGNDRRFGLAWMEHILGTVYGQMAQRSLPLSWRTIFKNIGAIIVRAPFAARKAERHLQRAIDLAAPMQARCLLGQSYLQLGWLRHTQHQRQSAQTCFEQAAELFQQCDATGHLEEARRALNTLKQAG